MRLRDDERGTATAEFALVVPAVLLVVALTAATLAGSARAVRLEHATAQAARLAARGEPVERVRAAFEAVGGGASVRLHSDGDLVCATGSADPAVPLPLPRLRATSCALGDGR